MTYRVVLADTGPLITLAAAESLNLLLLGGERVIVPDMILIEATRFMDKSGAEAILNWVRDTPNVSYVETEQAKIFLITQMSPLPISLYE